MRLRLQSLRLSLDLTGEHHDLLFSRLDTGLQISDRIPHVDDECRIMGGHIQLAGSEDNLVPHVDTLHDRLNVVLLLDRCEQWGLVQHVTAATSAGLGVQYARLVERVSRRIHALAELLRLAHLVAVALHVHPSLGGWSEWHTFLLRVHKKCKLLESMLPLDVLYRTGLHVVRLTALYIFDGLDRWLFDLDILLDKARVSKLSASKIRKLDRVDRIFLELLRR